MPKALKDKDQEKFCQQYVVLRDKNEALTRAYPQSSTWRASNRSRKANTLFGLPLIKERIKTLQDEALLEMNYGVKQALDNFNLKIIEIETDIKAIQKLIVDDGLKGKEKLSALSTVNSLRESIRRHEELKGKLFGLYTINIADARDKGKGADKKDITEDRLDELIASKNEKVEGTVDETTPNTFN